MNCIFKNTSRLLGHFFPRYSACIFFLLLLGGCTSLTYDPSFRGIAPSSPGTEFPGSFSLRETCRPPFTPEDLSEAMPLSQLLDIALYNNPSTRASWNAARAAAFAYRSSLSAYYPAIGYDGNLQFQKNNGPSGIEDGGVITSSAASTDPSTAVVDGSVTPTNAAETTTLFDEITGTYLLFDFGGRDALSRFALYALEQANWQHNVTMQQVMLRVISHYTSYLGNKALVQASERDLQDALVTLKAAEKMRSAGLATLTDILAAQSAVEQMRLNLAQAKGAEHTFFAELMITLGLPPDTKMTVVDLPEKLPVVEISGNISALLALAKERRPDLGAAMAVVKQKEAELGIAYSSGLPTLTLNASSSRLRFLNPSRSTATNQSVFVEWNYPLFQGYFFVNEQKRAQAEIQQALAQLDVTASEVSSSVVANYYAFKTAEAALPSSLATFDYSEKAYKGFLSKYKVGSSSVIDVLTALTTLSNARAQYILTRTQWAYSLSNLAFSVGVLEETGGGWREDPPKKIMHLKYTSEKPGVDP